MFHRIFYYYKEVGIKFILTEQNGLLVYRTKCAIVEAGMGKSGKKEENYMKKKKLDMFFGNVFNIIDNDRM